MYSAYISSDRSEYRKRIEKGLMLSLFLMILVFLFFRRFPDDKSKRLALSMISIEVVESIPQTTQGTLHRYPQIPEVPIPSEDEYLPEDETIAIIQPELGEVVGSFDNVVGVAQIEYDIPDFGIDDRLQAVQGAVTLAILVNQFGQVDSVKVLDNTTFSKTFEEEVIKSAYRTRYEFKDVDQQVVGWIERMYWLNM